LQLILIGQIVHAGEPGRIRMRADFDSHATLSHADLESGAIIREGVRARLVDEVDRDQELRRIARAVVGVTDRPEPNLIPAVWSVLEDGVPLIQIFDLVTERISCLGQIPRKHLPRVVGIPNRRWIAAS
jgi:hypothetical protein